MRDNLKILIPAAGFGRRVGSPNSKEVLLDENGRPLIEHALKITSQLGGTALVITRPEKTELRDYLENSEFQNITETILINESKEWPDSIIQVKSNWASQNLLILPDTRWQPESICQSLIASLEGTALSYGVFESSEDLKFGFVSTAQGFTKIIEKPEHSNEINGFKAWGLIAFRKEIGESLFQAHLDSTFDHQVKSLPVESKFYDLFEFRDLTR